MTRKAKPLYALGLNSGSSFDGVDAVLIDIDFGPDGQLAPPRYVDGISLDWPKEVQGDVLAAFSNTLSLFELTRLNYVVGAIFAQAARSLMEKHSLNPADVAVIGYDGQTVYQEPPEHDRMKGVADNNDWYKRWTEGGYPVGLQIGEPGVVASLVDVPVVTQFRSVDHALGGTGAPLMQFLDYIAFRDVAPIATLNIGGISNIQVADADRNRMLAFDCGPGNVMIDHAMRHFYSLEYDADGATAANGNVNTELLEELLEHPFFHRAIPRCAWRLDFGADYAEAILAKFSQVAPEDVVATFTRFSAEAIVRSLNANVPQLADIQTLIASGGGVRNATLLQEIRHLLPEGVTLTLSDEFGLPAQFKEAIKFATLAVATLNSIGNNIPHASGASRFGVLGKLVQAPRNARLV
jgi:anhydro-N-acetylmuramic acid kinase